MINLWGSVFTYFLEFILHLLTCNTKDAVLAELSLGHPSGGLSWTSRIYSWCLIVVVIQTQISKVFSFLFQIAFNFCFFEYPRLSQMGCVPGLLVYGLYGFWGWKPGSTIGHSSDFFGRNRVILHLHPLTFYMGQNGLLPC